MRGEASCFSPFCAKLNLADGAFEDRIGRGWMVGTGRSDKARTAILVDRADERQDLNRSTGHMPHGTVKWFNTTKGYGFIAPDDGGKDVFVHISAVERSGLTGLADNQKVSFEMQEGRDGRTMASDLQLL